MPRELTPQSSLETLRKEAKRWLKALQAGEPGARQLLKAGAKSTDTPKLRDVQHALAREYGFANWAGLKQALEDRSQSHGDRVRLFLEKSAIRYGVAPGSAQWNTYGPDLPANGAHAARLLERYPEIARESIHTAVAAGDVEAVRAFLARDPALADKSGGPDGWTPLLRLAHTRLPVPAASANSLEIARLLLDHGALPDRGWSDSENDFTVLTGAIGNGEQGQPAHPQAEALTRLLLERGADPLNLQALYNTSQGPDDTFWLDLLYGESERRGQAERWRQSAGDFIGRPVDYLLGNAVPRLPKRAAWLLDHGARGDALNAYSKQPIVKHSALAGRQDLVDLLMAHGAAAPALSGPERFLAASMQGDAQEMRALAQIHPECLRDPEAMFAAMRQGRADVAEILLDLGMSPDVGDALDFRALHYTTHCGAAAIAQLLIARGAEIDSVERRYNSTALGHALYQGRPDMIAIIAPVSRDMRGLCAAGALERVGVLLAQDPALARAPTRENGPAPLFCLPDDDEQAADLAELLLAHGADPRALNGDGLTPAQLAKKRGLEETAEILRAQT